MKLLINYSRFSKTASKLRVRVKIVNKSYYLNRDKGDKWNKLRHLRN